MRVSCIPRLASEFEVNADTLTDTAQTREDGFGTLGSEFLSVVISFIYALFGGVGVEVEGFPCCAERVRGAVWVGGFVLLNSAKELFMADIALATLLADN
jgi:hypothetical protein